MLPPSSGWWSGIYLQQLSKFLHTTRRCNPDDYNSNSELVFANTATCGTMHNHLWPSVTVMDSYVIKHVSQLGKLKFFSCVDEKRTDIRGDELILFLKTTLTLRLLMSYIYGAPSKARNAKVVYIWTYVWQRWKSLFLFAAQCFNTESMQRGFLCHICV